MDNQSNIILIHHIPISVTHFINTHTKCNCSYNNTTFILNPITQSFFLRFVLYHTPTSFIQEEIHDKLSLQNHQKGDYHEYIQLHLVYGLT